MKDFKPLAVPTRTAIPEKAPSMDAFLVKESFTLPTLLAFGGVFQLFISVVLPARFALLPIGFLAGHAIITTILQARSPQDSPLMVDIIPGRSTAQLPLPLANNNNNTTTTTTTTTSIQPNFGSTAASSPVVAFHLGVHFNHPMGPFCPGGSEIGAHFQAMFTDLQARRDEFDMLSATIWRGTTRPSHNGILMIAYFRSVDGLNRFAHDKVHREGWDWYHKFVRETGHRHFGLFHETFLSRPGEWETIYADCQPTLLGESSVRFDRREDEEPAKEGMGTETDPEAEVWIKPLVSADHPALKTQAKRMGMTLGLKREN
ncbi:hypothetical protein M406DRAFT_329653 [Cryphonectria parasitica EP155]|uniref:Monooxygenase n=1 Tax=Cryphonectria parasitica (strain ATCC 38755 / EP155) TaxID=660469 RepID=A0A9P4Y3D2_CRYP1|nr:uncharacterized protein M406DRAFT_329653 [Cryphonectria parasitica EP155]KAF3765788.1 hypothetical protein M406DRAFT_329653 [Cryphonectria parasitica EP155]